MERSSVSSILLDAGWARVLPERGVVLLEAVSRLEPVLPGRLDAHLEWSWELPQGLSAPAWTEVEQWTAAELRAVGLNDADAPTTNHQEVLKRSTDAFNYEANLSSLSLRIDHSVGGMLKLLVVCGVVVVTPGGFLRMNPTPPSALEVLPSVRRDG